jgi:hypothetical protein
MKWVLELVNLLNLLTHIITLLETLRLMGLIFQFTQYLSNVVKRRKSILIALHTLKERQIELSYLQKGCWSGSIAWHLGKGWDAICRSRNTPLEARNLQGLRAF